MQEGKAHLQLDSYAVVSKSQDVFYNPVMKHNRDVSVVIIAQFSSPSLSVGLPLAGSGVRAIRVMLESGKKITCYANDYDADAVAKIREHLAEHSVVATVSQKDANDFLLSSKGFDYVDVDPFGSPNPFLDAAIVRSSRNGILAVTATDTAPLCGTYPKSCARKYWAKPNRGAMKHEIGLRILIRKVQLIGTQYDKALVPLFCYSKDHYFRLFFRVSKSRDACDKLLLQHQHVAIDGNRFTVGSGDVGPLWSGSLIDREYCNSSFFAKLREVSDEQKWANIVESELDTFGYYDLHELSRELDIKIPSIPKVLEKLGKRGSRTHCNLKAVKTTLGFEEFCASVLGLSKSI